MSEQGGYTLSEVLVALAIASLLVIAAGQLLLTSVTTFAQVERLGRQQESLVYTATVLADRLRRHDPAHASSEALFHLRCQGGAEECRCTVQDLVAAQPLASFDRLGEGACARDEPLGVAGEDGALNVALPLGPQGRDVVFHVTPRQGVLSDAGAPP